MRIFNSLTRKKEEFIPLEEGKVKIYACGPTVYNYFHIGNARPFIVFDTLRRYFEYLGYDVTFVQNFTDIDDKMINAAAKEGITVKELGDRFIKEYFTDAQGLNVKPATFHPRATEHIKDIIALISKLIDNGHAYIAENGDVYYNVNSFEHYGRLSGQNLEDLEMGASNRVGDLDDVKHDPMDFALWKAKKEGEPAWDSPFSEGRPGWHIECSAMSQKYLGDTFDIHGGGQDLKFPHHDNEIAQSEGATGKPFARYWMHNGYININGEKMSKSKGNFLTVREISKKYDLVAVRLFMLTAQYRNPVNFDFDLLAQAESALARITNCLENLDFVVSNGKSADSADIDCAGYEERFKRAMDDDLNTAEALGVIFDLVKEINTVYGEGGDAEKAKEAAVVLRRLLDVLGLLKAADDDIPEDIREMAQKRAEARKEKNWKVADEMRDEIAKRGFELKDTPDGVKITRI